MRKAKKNMSKAASDKSKNGVGNIPEVIYDDFMSETMPHFQKIRGMARKLVRNWTDADDLVQDTYMQAWHSFGKYELGTNCGAWLFRILMNKYLSYRREFVKHAKHLPDVSESVIENSRSRVPVKEHLTNREVIRILKNVPEHYREVLMLVDVYGYAYKEAAHTLDIPMGTVMSRLNRARKRLRGELINDIEPTRRRMSFKLLMENYAWGN